MKKFLIVIIIIIILGIVIKLVRKKGRLNTELQIIESQRYIAKVIKQSLNDKLILDLGIQGIKSNDITMIGNIWGHNVMSFEIILNNIPEYSLDYMNKKLNNEFKKYIDNQELNTYIEITDIWILNDKLHLEISHLINEKTKSYIRDIKKI